MTVDTPCTISMKQLRPGESARVTGFNKAEPVYRRKLMAMGLTRGTEFQVLRVAPLGCPVAISVRGTILSLRLSEASTLQLEKC